MRRRALLATAAGVPAAIAGCLSEPSSEPTGDDSADPDSDDDWATADDDSSSDTDDSSNDDPIEAFDVALERPSYVISMSERGPTVSSNNVTSIDELSGATADAVTAAIDDGEYETSEPSDDLLDGLQGLAYVEADGTVYDLERTMPEHVVSASDVDEGEIDEEATIGMYDEQIRVLDVDNREVVSAVNAVVSRDGPTGGEYRASALDAELESFLERYEYVAYPHDGDEGPEPEGYVELETDFDDPGAPYSVQATALTDEDLYETTVTDAEEYPDDVVDALRAAAEGRNFQIDELPDGFESALEDEGSVRVDGSVYDPDVDEIDREAVPATVDVRSVEPDDRAFTLAIEADEEDDVRVFSGAPAPFGVLTADGDGDSGGTLWSDAYEDDGHVHVEGPGRLSVNDIGLTTDLEPGTPLEETYEVHSEWGFRGGTYVVAASASIEWGDEHDGESASYPFELRLEVPPLE